MNLQVIHKIMISIFRGEIPLSRSIKDRAFERGRVYDLRHTPYQFHCERRGKVDHPLPDLLEKKVSWDSGAAGIPFKGPVADKITGCPGTEQRLVFLAIGDSRIELVQYTPRASGK